MIGLTLGIGLMFSAQQFSLMRVELCNAYSSNTEFCTLVNENGIDIRSVIGPTEFAIQNYTTIVLFLSCLVFSCTIFRNFLPADESRATVYTERDIELARRVRNRNIHSDQHYLDEIINYLYRHRQNFAEVLDDHEDHEVVLPSQENWKLSPYSPNPDITECAICLGSFDIDPVVSVRGIPDELNEDVSVLKVKHKPQSPFNNEDNQQLQNLNSPREESSRIVAQIPCGHIFHQACILNWSIETGSRVNIQQRNLSCPVCRSNL